jgi:hypothetical protein
LLAGIAGTAAMTSVQALAQRFQSSSEGHESSQADDPWAQAPAPAQVAKRIGEDVLHVDIPPELIPALTQLMHWAYGISWGVIYGVANRHRRAAGERRFRRGMRFGLLVWAVSYTQLVPLGIYEPPWRYSPGEVAIDLAYHEAFGLGTVFVADR